MKIETAPIQFSLKALFVTQACLCGVLALASVLGVEVVTFPMLFLILLVLWTAAMARAPVATKYATVFTVMGLLLLPLMFNGLLGSREDARRAIATDNLRMLGLPLHQQMSGPRPMKEFVYRARPSDQGWFERNDMGPSRTLPEGIYDPTY